MCDNDIYKTFEATGLSLLINNAMSVDGCKQGTVSLLALYSCLSCQIFQHVIKVTAKSLRKQTKIN